MEMSTALPLIISGVFIYIYREIFAILDRIKHDVDDIRSHAFTSKSIE